MKEHFEDRKLHGLINVKCKNEDGTFRYWQTTKQEVVKHIIDIVRDYQEDGYTLTLRQLHYQLVTKNWIVNHDTAYKKLGTILDDCRYAGIIDWSAIEDRGRVPYLEYAVNDIENALQDTYDQYKLDRQRNQNNVIELWTEKDALSGILRRSTDKYHCRLVVNKGYSSSSAMYNAYNRIVENVKVGRRTTILYFGDHDPSGLDMVRDIRERLYMMLRQGKFKETFISNNAEAALQIIPIGLTMRQIEEYDLPPNPTKLTDTRSAKYVEEFGPTCWEVDALNPRVLTQLVDDNIEDLIDMYKYEELRELEEKEKAELKTIIDQYSK